jgi:hypothetical protein
MNKPDEFLGGMWAVVATVSIFKGADGESLSAGRSRLAAMCVSFAQCLAYLVIWFFYSAGMTAPIGIGAALKPIRFNPNDRRRVEKKQKASMRRSGKVGI